jgi:MYXO-CTERM domain-containing protein
MKNLTITTLAAFFVALAAHGQGTVNFSNIGASGGITNGISGGRVPVGTAFMVALYFAPEGTTAEGQFMQLGAATGIAPAAGLFSGGTRTAPAGMIPAGGMGHFQVRVWESAFGTSYEAAAGRGLTGTSGILRVDTGDPTTVPPGTPASLVAANVVVVSGRALSQGIVLVPEPSTYALGLLGLGLVALLRRRRS